MKKTYNQPNMKVADLDLHAVLCSESNPEEVDLNQEGYNPELGSDSREITNLWDKEW